MPINVAINNSYFNFQADNIPYMGFEIEKLWIGKNAVSGIPQTEKE